MDTYISFFSLQKNYNKKELDRAYQKKLSSTKKMNLSVSEQKIFEEKIDEIYKILDSHLDNKYKENSGSYEKLFMKSQPKNNKVLDPFSSLNSVIEPFYKQPFFEHSYMNNDMFNDLFDTNLFKSEFDNGTNMKTIFTSQSHTFISNLNPDGSRLVINERFSNNNGEKNQVIESYEIDTQGKKKPLSNNKINSMFESNYGINSDIFIEN